jgi:hypothetical protein
MTDQRLLQRVRYAATHQRTATLDDDSQINCMTWLHGDDRCYCLDWTWYNPEDECDLDVRVYAILVEPLSGAPFTITSDADSEIAGALDLVEARA